MIRLHNPILDALQSFSYTTRDNILKLELIYIFFQSVFIEWTVIFIYIIYIPTNIRIILLS